MSHCNLIKIFNDFSAVPSVAVNVAVNDEPPALPVASLACLLGADLATQSRLNSKLNSQVIADLKFCKTRNRCFQLTQNI